MHRRFALVLRFCLLLVLVAGASLQPQLSAYALTTLTVEPLTWNVIGLDSNNVSVGPNHFPIGARVCNTGGEPATNVTATFQWDSADPYINLRSGTLSAINLGTLSAGTCADAYFEVEVTRNSNAYDHTRDYHIDVTAGNVTGTISTPQPRELYVEHLISQSRNTVSDIRYGAALGSLTSVANGGTLNLMVGNTYYIQLVGSTATQGYEQIETFVNFPNTIFQILSVDTTYSAESSTSLTPPYDQLYGDACVWENDLSSPNYRACLSTGKAGGNITVTYQVKILQVPGAPLVNPQPLSTLIYDFSGSSFHYNADYGVSTRYANIMNASITKSFSPKTITPGETSTLTFTINNPGAASMAGVNFTDDLPSGMTLANSSVAYSGCGAALPATVSDPMSFSNITVAGLSTCTIAVTVTSAADGTYNNTSGNLFLDTTNTGSSASDSLVVSSRPPIPTSCSNRLPLATWNLENYTASTAQQNGPFTYSSKQTDVSTATAVYESATGSSSGIANTTFFPTGWSAPATTGNSGNSWGVRGGWLDANPASPATATTPYFQFEVDASNYAGLGITASYNLQGNWSNSGNWYVLYSTDGTNWSSSTGGNGAWDKTNAWQTGTAAITVTTTNTTPTVYFRVFAAGAQYGGNPKVTTGTLYLDDIQITGCALPSVPTLSKSFSPISIPTGNTSTLTFTLTNPNTASTLTGVSFSDVLPAGLTVSSASTAACSTGTLTTTAPRTISLSGGTINASSTCTINVTVTGATAGSYTNVSSSVSSTESGPNTTAAGYGTASLTVVDPPSLAKSFNANPIFTGSNTALDFDIVNPNASTALTGVTFTDVLPAGLSVADGTFSVCGGTNNLTTTSATRTIALSNTTTIAAGGTCSFSVTATGSTAGSYTNTTGNISSTNGGTGNTATANVLVKTPAPAINLLKQVGPTASGPWTSFLTAAAGSNVYYRFTVENTGDLSLSGVSVDDPTVSTASCSWTRGDSAAPVTSPFTLPVADADNNHIATCVLGPISAVSGLHTNTAEASGTSGSTVQKSSSATYGTPEITIAKSVTQTSFSAAGDVLNYSYLVTNSGDAPLMGLVTVSDDKITAPNSVSCPAVSTVGDHDAWFDVGESITCTANYTVQAGDATAGFVTNSASATVGGVTSNIDSETVNQIRPELTITKTNNVSGSVAQNGSFTWTLTVANGGTANAVFTAGQTILSDPLPAGPTYGVPSTGSFTGITNSGNINCSITAGTLSCTASGADVTVGAGGSFTVSFTVAPTAAGSLPNTATVDPNGNITESNETNNTGSDTVNVTAVIDISLDKQVSNTAPNVGSTVTFTLAVANAGPGTATNIVVTDVIPSGYTYVGSSIGGGTSRNDSSPAGSGLTWTVNSLASGASTSLTYQATVLGSGTYENYAEITSHTETDSDSTPGDGSTTQDDDDTEAVTPIVSTPADLTVTKTNNTASGWVASGDPFQWTITARNGLSAGTASFANGDVILNDNLPTGQTYGAVTVTDGTTAPTGTIDCSITGTTLSCVANGAVTLPADSSFSVTFNVTTSGTANLSNTATVDPNNQVPESNEGNNSGSNTVTVFDSAPLKTIVATSESTTSIGSDGFVRAAIGEIVRYRLSMVVPEGGPFTNVQLLDNIPTGFQVLNDGSARVAFVSSTSGTVTSAASGSIPAITSALANCGGLNIVGNSAAVSPTCPLPDLNMSRLAASNDDVYGTGIDVYFKFGTITNTENDADNEYIVIEFNALALNINSGVTINQAFDNVSGAAGANSYRDNNAIQRVSGSTIGSDSADARVIIAEPAITDVAKSVSSGPYNPGSAITYTLTFSNVASGDNAATAFDIALTDTLDANLTPGTISVSSTQTDPCIGGTAFTTDDGSSGQNVTIGISCLDPGRSVTITVDATINPATADGTNISNTANVTYTSLPAAQGNCAVAPFTCTGVGASGSGTGERSGSGGAGADGSVLNNFADSGTVAFTVADTNDLPVANDDTNTTSEDTPVNGDVTGNDTLSGDGGNTWSLVGVDGGATHGTVTMNPDGTYAYTPDANYHGTDVFNYQLCDVDGECDPATVTITINSVDDVPVADDDTNTTNEDTPVNGDVSGNDTVSGDGGNTWSLVGVNGGAAHGTVTMNPDGTYTYTPDANYTGIDVFNYQICDVDGDCDPATVTVTINAVDDAPVADNDTAATNEDTSLNGDVTGNDTLSGDGGNTWNKLTDPAHGILAFNNDGTYTYTPNANYNGTDSFTYEICDVDGDCDPATVTITINAIDDAPIADDDTNTTNEDTPVNGDVTGNDTLSGDGSNTWSLVGVNGGATHGTVTMNPDGTYTYTPDTNYNGTDSFTYEICDVDGDCDPATVIITIDPVDDAPVADDDTNTTNEDTPVNGDVTGNDTLSGDGGNTWTKLTDPAHGTLVFNSDGTYTYTPNANYNGIDSFTYEICDMDGDCEPAAVTITIDPIDDAPVAEDDNATTDENTPLNGDVTGNDTLSGDGGNTWNKLTDPAHGTLVFNSDGTYTYTPTANYSGTDSFTYEICDVDGDCDPATVTITIDPVDDAPVANDDTNTTSEDTAVNGDVTGNDALSGDGGNTWNKLTDPAHGTVVFNSDGTYTYTPNANYNGTDSFTYEICDVDDDCEPATVTITINAVNDPPTATDNEASVDATTPTHTNNMVTGNEGNGVDSDPDADALTVTQLGTETNPANDVAGTYGSINWAADGSYTYTLNTSDPDYLALAVGAVVTDTFPYIISDGNGGTATANVIITIIKLVGPDAIDDTNTTAPGTSVTTNVLTNDNLGTTPTTITSFTQPANGSVTCTGNNCIYTPNTGFSGVDTFTYTITDDSGLTDAATVRITVGNIFDPPFGLKTFNAAGLPVLRWTMVWINNSNTTAINVQVTDPISAGTTFAGNLVCTPTGVSTTALCQYDAGTNQVIWRGNLGPDDGATNAGNANNEVLIAFDVTVASGITSVQNVATSDYDGNGDGDLLDAPEQDIFTVSSTWSSSQPPASRTTTSSSLLPATGFAPDVVTDLSHVPQQAYTATGDVTVEIPSLGVKLPVVGIPKKDGTWNVSWLSNQAGWLEGTAFPSWSGNSVLTSHVYLSNGLPGPFVNLGKLKFGDKVIIHAYGQKYTFEVRENMVVEPDDKSVMKHEEKSWLTLVTCKEYDPATNTYRKRAVVRAVLVSVTAE